MKLATLKDGTRDGRLVVVSRDLTRCSEVGHIARTLQAALDDWDACRHRGSPRVAEGLETGAQPSMRFHEHDALRRCRAPISGRTARPMSTTSSWCARRAAPRCRRASGPIR